MARDISELGADVFDDTIPQGKHRISPKKRNYIIGLSVTGVLLVGLVIGVVVLCNTALTDYSNVRNVKYYYTPESLLEKGEKPTATLYQLDSDKKYPSTFRIPSQVRGYKVTAIGEEAFLGHDEIKRVIIPNTVTSIGERAFYNCTNLAKFTFSKNISYVGTNAFLNTKFYNDITSDSTRDFTLPSGILIYVGNDFFEPNTALISDSVSDEEVERIKTEYGAKSIKKFSDLKIKKLGSAAFKDNDKIVYLDLPKGITNLPTSIFEGCYNLKGFDSSNSSITSIDDYAFKGCEQLRDIVFGEGLEALGKEAFAKTGITDVPDLSKVDENKIGESVFANCKSLEEVTYPIKKVPNKMFSGCSHLKTIQWGENNSAIDNIDSFGYGAFTGTGFVEFTVPKNVSVISDELLMNAKKLKTLRIYGNPNNKVVQEEVAEGEEKEQYIDEDGNLKDGRLLGISSIKTRAFSGCTSLSSIVTYGENNEDLLKEEGTFYFPNSLKLLNASSTNDDSEAFRETAAEKIVLKNNVKNIGKYCFADMGELKEVVLPEKGQLTRLYGGSFQGDKKLETINMVKSINMIDASSFKNCESLKGLDLKKTQITSLNAEVLYNCQSVETLTIPATVQNIKKHAFYNVNSLNEVYIPESVDTILADAFKFSKERETKLKIYVQKEYDILVEGSASDANYAKTVDKDGNITWTWFDDNCEVYYLLGDGTPVEGINYWDGVIPE